MRIRTRWHDKNKPKSPEEIASVLAFTGWRWARRAIERMLVAGFQFPSDARRFGILSEYLVFQLQTVDRRLHGRLTDDERRRWIVALALRLADMLWDNQRELMGEGNYRQEFLDLVNARGDDYAGLPVGPEGPGYAHFRYLAEQIRDRVDPADQRWLYEQVMEVEAPEAVRTMHKSVDGLLAPPA